MFERQGFKKAAKQSRKSRRNQNWDGGPKRERERQLGERNENRRSPKKFRDEEDMDWRDLLMEENDEDIHGR
jgi:hypothetical protein